MPFIGKGTSRHKEIREGEILFVALLFDDGPTAYRILNARHRHHHHHHLKRPRQEALKGRSFFDHEGVRLFIAGSVVCHLLFAGCIKELYLAEGNSRQRFFLRLFLVELFRPNPWVRGVSRRGGA